MYGKNFKNSIAPHIIGLDQTMEHSFHKSAARITNCDNQSGLFRQPYISYHKLDY